MVIDRDLGSRAIFLEAGRRLGGSWSVDLEARIFTAADERDLLSALRRDDSVTLNLAWNL